jgi:hypothetical protein
VVGPSGRPSVLPAAARAARAAGITKRRQCTRCRRGQNCDPRKKRPCSPAFLAVWDDWHLAVGGLLVYQISAQPPCLQDRFACGKNGNGRPLLSGCPRTC